MRRFFLALLGFSLLLSSCYPGLNWFSFRNESEVTLIKVVLTTPLGITYDEDNLENTRNFSRYMLTFGNYIFKIQSHEYVGYYRFKLTSANPYHCIVLDKFFQINGQPLDHFQFAPSEAYRKLEADIDRSLEQSRNADMNLKSKRTELLSSYLQSAINVTYNGNPLISKEEIEAEIDNFDLFEISYTNLAIMEELETKLATIKEEYLKSMSYTMKNMLKVNGIAGAIEDDNYIYYNGNAVHKLDYKSADLIKYYCGIDSRRASKMGFDYDPISILF